ncbi:hypothetical protein RQ479_04065 [Mesorhizobium sp. ISC25]|uniref:hypothetical protein n=1 Tax=Mesorhizobium sp. ISC25 TaxID=3077335 RepID=UPI0035DB76F2
MSSSRTARNQKRIGNCILAERRPRLRGGYSKTLQRLAEVERLIADRYGQFLPLSEVDSFLIVAWKSLKDPKSWLRRYAPNIVDVDAVIDPIARSLEWRDWNLNGSDAGTRLQLLVQERQRLRITTMWAADLPIEEQKAAAKAARKERDRVRIAEKRKQERKPREVWLAEHSTNRDRPWEAMGIGRRAYYYRLKKANCTGVSHLTDADCTRLSPLENTFGVLDLIDDQSVQSPSLVPTFHDLISDASGREAGPSRPARPYQLDMFETINPRGTK